MDALRLVPVDVRVELHESCHVHPEVDRAWETWSNAAEAGLLIAYKTAGRPLPTW